MNKEAWITLIFGLLSGGAMGAVIKILYDRRQGGVQGILNRVKIFPLFDRTKAQGFDAVLKVKHEASEIEYGNIFVADVTVINSGRSDFAEFEFGVENSGAECIHATWENPDQHHTLILIEPVTPALPKTGIKLSARPFNRKDSYSLRLYLTSGQKRPETPRLTSPHSIRFVGEPPREFTHLLLKFGLVALLIVQLVVLSKLYLDRSSMRRIGIFSFEKHAETEFRFSSTPPLPAGFGHVRPGMKLSEVRTALPDGEIGTGLYRLQVDSGPFSAVSLPFVSSEGDPRIDVVFFHYRDERAKDAVFKAVLDRFGQLPHKTMDLGTRLVWPEINGFQVTLGSAYIIAPAIHDPEETPAPGETN